MHVFIEYLFELSIDDLMKLAKDINDKNVSSLVFQCYNKKNVDSVYTPKLLDFVNTNLIERLHFDSFIDLDYLVKF